MNDIDSADGLQWSVERFKHKLAVQAVQANRLPGIEQTQAEKEAAAVIIAHQIAAKKRRIAWAIEQMLARHK